MGAAWELEQHASADYDFYSVPANFSSTLTPGSLLRVEEFTNLSNYAVPVGLTMSRIMYTTTDLNGTVISTSAYILWPYSQSEDASESDSGYPLVGWAHGTSGYLRSCAPSNYRNLQYHFMAPFVLALQGMAVVAPDYAGLGVNSTFTNEHIGYPWAAGPAQANDPANAIIAARRAFPTYLKPSGPFVAMGHSVGGQAAWAFAQRQVDQPLDGYKGTVAIAPPTNLIKQAELAMEDPTQEWAATILSNQPKLVAAVTAVYPAYNHSGMSAESYRRWHNILETLSSACLPTDTLVNMDLNPDDVVQPDWIKAEPVQAYSEMIDTGRKKFRGPLLIVAGKSDVIVPFQVIESSLDDTCSMLDKENWRESLEMVTYESMNHFPVIQASQSKWLWWVKERLSSKASKRRTGCSKSVVNGFRSENTAPAPFPNFLEQWASPDEFWKYLL